jgi:adenylate kinase family enzyme
MQRVLVIGSGGAGKSTFATALGQRLGIPVVHLDAQYWRSGWVATPSEQWHARVAELVAGDRWIMDGNYGGTLTQRLAACDTVIFLDLPRTTCLWRVVRRTFRYAGQSRPDMTPGCPERLTWAFAWWVWTYPTARRPRVLAQLAEVSRTARVVRLRSAREVAHFLSTAT